MTCDELIAILLPDWGVAFGLSLTVVPFGAVAMAAAGTVSVAAAATAARSLRCVFILLRMRVESASALHEAHPTGVLRYPKARSSSIILRNPPTNALVALLQMH